MKKLNTLLFGALACALLVSCAQNQAPAEIDYPSDYDATAERMIDETGTVAFDSPRDAYNLLTGEYNLAQDRVGMRLFAFDVNNIYDSWPSAGLSQADVLIEYDAAGGIPRFIALYSEIRDLPRIGSLRSLRMSGVNAVYQMDPVVVCLGTIIWVDSFYKQTGFRIWDTNYTRSVLYLDEERHKTYASEHCWYTSGAMLYSGMDDEAAFIKPEHKGAELQPIFNFNPAESPAVPADGSAVRMTVDFSAYVARKYGLQFDYDAETARWMRSEYGEPHIDANTGEQLGFENVLILFCTNEPYENTQIMNIQYERGGRGVWLSRGGYQYIQWIKDGAEGSFVLTTENGEPLFLNAGKTSVSMIDKQYADTLTLA